MIDAALSQKETGRSSILTISFWPLLQGLFIHVVNQNWSIGTRKNRLLNRVRGLRLIDSPANTFECHERIGRSYRLTESRKSFIAHCYRSILYLPKRSFHDRTTIFTCTDTLNDRNTEAQRGCNKQGRHDLRQLGLCCLAATPGFLTLYSTLFTPGFLNDITPLQYLFTPCRAYERPF